MSKYIPKLTMLDVQNLLEQNGYKLATDILDNQGEKIPAIERDENAIFVRAYAPEDPVDTVLAYELAKKHPGFMSMAMIASLAGGFSHHVSLILLKDFEANLMFVSDYEEKAAMKLHESYIHFMDNKFPGEFRKDYINSINENNQIVNPSDDNTM